MFPTIAGYRRPIEAQGWRHLIWEWENQVETAHHKTSRRQHANTKLEEPIQALRRGHTETMSHLSSQHHRAKQALQAPHKAAVDLSAGETKANTPCEGEAAGPCATCHDQSDSSQSWRSLACCGGENLIKARQAPAKPQSSPEANCNHPQSHTEDMGTASAVTETRPNSSARPPPALPE